MQVSEIAKDQTIIVPRKESYSLEMCFIKCNNVYLQSIYFAVLKITSELIMRIHREAIDGGTPLYDFQHGFRSYDLFA